MNRRSAAMLGAIAVSLSLLTGCFSFSMSTNKVVGGKGYYVYFYKHATDDVVDKLHYGAFHGNPRLTLGAMLTWAKDNVFKGKLARLGMSIADLDYFFHSDNDDDFAGAAADVRSTQRCLVMHRNPTPLVTDRHNWTYRNYDDGHCAWGKSYF